MRYPGILPFTASPVKIGPYCDRKPSLPACMLPPEVKTSRMLYALEKKHEEYKERMADKIIEKVYVYGGGRIEIFWKMEDIFFTEDKSKVIDVNNKKEE